MAECGCTSHGSFLTEKGLEEAAQRERQCHGLDTMEVARYLDNRSSVSAMVEVEDDFDYDPKHVEMNFRHPTFLQLVLF